MSDDIKANEADASKTVADATKTVSDDTTKQVAKKYDEEYVNTVKAESIERGKKLKEAEEKLKKLEDEKLSDIEKKDKRIKELEDKEKDTQESIKASKIDSLITEAISDKNIADKPAMKLLIKQELATEEEINEKIVEKVVDKLIKDNPSRISSTTLNPGDGNFPKKDSGLAKTTDEMFGDFLHNK